MKKQNKVISFSLSALVILGLFLGLFVKQTEAQVFKPVANFGCNGLSATSEKIILGQSIVFKASVSNYGIIRSALVTKVGDRVVGGKRQENLGFGFTEITGVFKPTRAGLYAVEANAYESDQCRALCSAGKTLYLNTRTNGGACATWGHWKVIGACSSNKCIKWVTVEPK